MRPIAFRPSVMALDSTNAPPVLPISPFQAMTIMTGRRTTIIEARRLRHCVVRSALNSDINTALTEGSARGAGRGSEEAMLSAGEVVDMANYFLNVFWFD